jgi:1-aminocyclopropane-1-carboxylate deaminase/D-cysteine desulfhydrase-like pyridoxal-dependent ACC family enzyme
MGHWGTGRDILFVHTGGAPSLHAYEDVLDPARADHV